MKNFAGIIAFLLISYWFWGLKAPSSEKPPILEGDSGLIILGIGIVLASWSVQ